MAAETIYSHRRIDGVCWCIERQPEGVTDPMVVSFRKWNGSRSLLNRSARWTGTGWDPTRWHPRPPTVPAFLIDKIERHMKGLNP